MEQSLKILRSYMAPSPRARYDLECVCGKLFSAWACSIESGHTRSCGCLRSQRPLPTVESAGQLKVLRAYRHPAPTRRSPNLRKTRLDLECFCGKLFTAWAGSIQSGNTRSCGCLRKAHYAKMRKLRGFKRGNQASRLRELDSVRDDFAEPEMESDGGAYRSTLRWDEL